jgi:hypothetical protein
MEDGLKISKVGYLSNHLIHLIRFFNLNIKLYELFYIILVWGKKNKNENELLWKTLSKHNIFSNHWWEANFINTSNEANLQ